MANNFQPGNIVHTGAIGGERYVIMSARQPIAQLIRRLPLRWRLPHGDYGYEVRDMPHPSRRSRPLFASPANDLSLVTDASPDDRAAAAALLAEHRAGSGTAEADEPRVPVDITRW